MAARDSKDAAKRLQAGSRIADIEGHQLRDGRVRSGATSRSGLARLAANPHTLTASAPDARAKGLGPICSPAFSASCASEISGLGVFALVSPIQSVQILALS